LTLTFTFLSIKGKGKKKMNIKMKSMRIRDLLLNGKDDQKGQALIIVLAFLVVVSLVLTSALTVVGTSLVSNRTYVNNTTSMFAAEAGIQDGIWQMLNNNSDKLSSGLLDATTSQSTPQVAFSDYDYNSHGWTYTLPDQVNNYDVHVNVTNEWIPLIAAPASNNDAVDVLTNNGGTANLTLTGGVDAVPIYTLHVTYTGTALLSIHTIGVWLPQGFTYNNGSSNLQDSISHQWLYTTEQVVNCAGNEAVIWTFSGKTYSSLLSSMGQTGNSSIEIDFQYTASVTKFPEAISWITVTANADFGFNYTWNADVRVYSLVADAGNTEIKSCIPKNETRMLGSVMAGDYVATGGSVLYDADGDGNREAYVASSSNTIASSAIPNGASVAAAYLYWAGWAKGNGTDMISGFYDPSVTLKVNSSANQTITVSPANPDDIIWYDAVRSGRSGTITITAGSKNVTGSGTSFSADVRVGDKISLNDGAKVWYTVASVTNNTHLVLTLNATSSSAGTNSYCVFDGYYYACKKDVTDIVRDYSTGANLTASPQLFGNGTGNYTISDLSADTHCVQHPGEICTSAYAGWSLVVVYSDASTTGHQLYLFDNFQSISNTSGDNITEISGFIVPQRIAGESTSADAARLTVFVGEGDKQLHPDHVGLIDQNGTEHVLWDGITDDTSDTQVSPNDAFNSESPGITAPGVDIDTFHITWSDNIVKQGDTQADINIYTNGDGLVSIYVIASFRSSITTGGSVSYLISRKAP